MNLNSGVKMLIGICAITTVAICGFLGFKLGAIVAAFTATGAVAVA